MNKLFLTGVAVLVVIISGYLLFGQGAPQTTAPTGEQTGSIQPATEISAAAEAMADQPAGTVIAGDGLSDDRMVDDTILNFSGRILAGTKAKLYDFNQSDYEKALASDNLLVLYFYANWCPICKAEVQNSLYPAFHELKVDKVVGFRVNFNDSETDDFEEKLAREFGVAYQHTKVFIKDSKRILKSPEQWNKDRYLSEIAEVNNN
jgi:thiol-disulfide isomerase/thioredoxin